MIWDSNYWISAVALEPVSNHEIVILEKDLNNRWNIRHANCENDWLYNQAAYVNMPLQRDMYGNPIPINIKSGDMCRCLIIDVTIK